jgi:L-ribulokinase
LAVDWFNGRRTPNANPYLKAGIFNLDLASDAPNIFRSLVETTCFGSKKIVEHFIEKGIPIKGIIALGGVARKSDFVMQTMADVIGVPIKVNTAEQSCALGSAMFATVVAGIYDDVETAASFLGQGFDKIYKPDLESTKLYNERYKAYQQIGDFLEAK